jgi:two-component system, chemotaxis family, chemotaxis protein CheY
MKILIVEDSRVMRQILVRALRQAGFSGHELVLAEDGLQGLRAVRDHAPELVLSGWNMPHMNGLELLTSLRASGNPVRFGFVTAEGSCPEVVEKAEAAGALFVVPKPFSAEDLADALGPVLR